MKMQNWLNSIRQTCNPRRSPRRRTRRFHSSRAFSPKALSVERLEERTLLTTVVWDGTGDGSSWSDADNWSTSSVPGATDSAIISNGGAVTVDIAVDVNDLKIVNGSVDAGNFGINISQDFIVSPSGTFNGGTGTVTLDGKKTHQVIDIGTTILNDLDIAKTDNRFNVALVGTVEVNGDLTVTEVNNINGGTIQVGGDVLTTDNAVGGTGTVRLSGLNAITTDADGGELPNLLIDGGTTDASTPSYLGVQDMTVTGGAFLAPASGRLGIADDFTVSGGTFSAGSGTVTLNGKKTHQLIDIGTTILNDLDIAKTDNRFNVALVGTVEVNGDLTVTEVNNINGGTIQVGGNVLTTDNAVGGTGTVRLSGVHAITTDADGGELPNLLIDGGTTDASTPSYLGVQDMTVTGGTFLAPAPGRLGIADDFTVSAGTFSAGSGTVTLNGKKTHQLIDINNIPLNNVTIAKTDNRFTVTVIAGDDLDVNGDFMLTKGKFVASGTVFVAANFTFNPLKSNDARFQQNGTGLLHFDTTTPFRGNTNRSNTIDNFDLNIERVQFGGFGFGGSGSKVTNSIGGSATMVVSDLLTLAKSGGGSSLEIVLNGGTIETYDVVAGTGAAGGTTQIVMTGGTVTGSATNRLPSLVITGTVGSATVDVAAEDFTVSSGGRFTAPTGELRVSGNFTIEAGGGYDQQTGGGTLYFDPTSPFLGVAPRYVTIDAAVFDAALIKLDDLRFGGTGNGGDGSGIDYQLDFGNKILEVDTLTVRKTGGWSNLNIVLNNETIDAVFAELDIMDYAGGTTILNPTPQYTHEIFVLSNVVGTTIDTAPKPNEFSSAEGADYICNYNAYFADKNIDWDGVELRWKAVISTFGVVHAKDRLTIAGPIYNVAGDLIATDAADLWDGNLANPVLYDENGVVPAGNTTVWTGTDSTGGYDSSCGNGDWSSTIGFAVVGDFTESNSLWIFGNTALCNSLARLYCLSPAQLEAINPSQPLSTVSDPGVQEMTVTSGTFLAPAPATLGTADNFIVSATAGSGTVTPAGGNTAQAVNVDTPVLNDLTNATTDNGLDGEIVGTAEGANDQTVTEVSSMEDGVLSGALPQIDIQ